MAERTDLTEGVAEVIARHGGFEFDSILNPTKVTCYCEAWEHVWGRPYDRYAPDADSGHAVHIAEEVLDYLKRSCALDVDE